MPIFVPSLFFLDGGRKGYLFCKLKWKGLSYLDGERPFDPDREGEETDLDQDCDTERRDGFFFGDLLKAYPIFVSGYLCYPRSREFDQSLS